MKRLIKMLTIIASVLIFFGLIIFFTIQLTSNHGYEVKKERVINNPEIENLKVETSLPVKVTKGSEFKITYRSNYELNIKQQLQTLKIQQPRKINLSNLKNEKKGYLNITIPRTTYLNKVVLNSKNNNLYVSNLMADYLDINNKNSHVFLDNLSNQRTQLSNEKGKVNINNLNTYQLELENASGLVKLNDLTSNYVSFENGNGNVSLKNKKQLFYETLDVDNDKGNIKLNNIKIKHFLNDNSKGSINYQNVVK